MITEYFFWFAQPSASLNSYDFAAFYIFAGLVGLAAILGLVRKLLVRHEVTKALLGRFQTAFFWTGVVGLIWSGFRYEAVPIFSRRAFAGGILLAGLVWVAIVKYYFFFRFRKDKEEYDYLQVKNKYIR